MVEMKSIQKIPIQQIDLSDETFSVNFLPDLRNLRSSIKQVGLLQPVLLRSKSDGYQIVRGFRRISILNELGSSEVESMLLEERGMNERELFTLSLHENLTARGLNTVEKAIALEKLIYRFQLDSAVVIKTFLPLFSLEPNEKILNTYLSLARMEDEVKRYVLKEEVSRSNIRRLSAFTPDDRMAILSLISYLKLGENRLREMFTLLEEISKRDQIMVKEIVGHPKIQAILSQKEITPSQRTEHVKKILLDLRYPKMRQREMEFEEKRRTLNLPSGVSLHHQPFFEGKGFKLEFQFETLEEYRSILSSLLKIVDKEEFKEMIKNS